MFEKIDASLAGQLKSRFAGKQKSAEKDSVTVPGLDIKQITSVEQMEEAITKQVCNYYYQIKQNFNVLVLKEIFF